MHFEPYGIAILVVILAILVAAFWLIGGIIRAGIGSLFIVGTKTIFALAVCVIAYHAMVWVGAVGSLVYLFNVSVHYAKLEPEMQAKQQDYMRSTYWPQMHKRECDNCKQYEFAMFNKSERESEAACIKYCTPTDE